MYHFNPISDCELFENMETQHFYGKDEVMQEGMYQYIYWYLVDYEVFKNRKDNEIYKRVELNSKRHYWNNIEYLLSIKNGNCIVPEGVTSIGNDCLDGCTSLTNIELPSSLRSIGENVFRETNVKTITIPEGVTSIGNHCFNGCSSLTNIQLPSTLINIGEKTFYETGIIDVIIEGVKKLECKVPEFIKKILESKGIECPNSCHDKEDSRREAMKQIYEEHIIDNN